MGNVFFNSASELATLNNTFTVNGVATDPTVVSIVITSPSGVVSTVTPSKVSTGVYTYDVTCNEAGEWQAEWLGTGAAVDTEMVSWTVFETQIGKLYVTVQALKSRLKITNSADDYELHAACFSVSRMIEQWCDRHFWMTASSEARTFVPQGFYNLVLPAFSELVSVTTLQTDESGDGVFETTWSTSDYQLWPPNPTAVPEPKPYKEIKVIGTRVFPIIFPGIIARADRIKITGVYGWPEVPWGVRQAALILAAEAYKAKDAPFGSAGEGEFAFRHYETGVLSIAQRFLGPYMRTPVRVA